MTEFDKKIGKNWAIDIGATDVTAAIEEPSEEDKGLHLFNAITNDGAKEEILDQVCWDIARNN